MVGASPCPIANDPKLVVPVFPSSLFLFVVLPHAFLQVEVAVETCLGVGCLVLRFQQLSGMNSGDHSNFFFAFFFCFCPRCD